MIYITTDRSIISLERNEVVTIMRKPRERRELPFGFGLIRKAMSGKIFSDEDRPLISDVSEVIDVPIQRGLTVGRFVSNGAAFMGPKWGKYSARDNNCQDFVVDMLHANGLLTLERNAWIKQDTKDLFDDDNYLRRFTNTITDAGAVFAPYKPGFMASSWRDQGDGMNIVGQYPNTDKYRHGMKLYHNLDIPFMRAQGDLMSDADITSPGFRVEVEQTPLLHRFSNLSRTFVRTGDDFDDDTPMEARRRRKVKNPFTKKNFSLKQGSLLREAARSVITGSVGTDLTNLALKEAGVGFQIPDNRELLNMALDKSGTGLYVPSEGEMIGRMAGTR